jgi:hypothetical protein
MPPTIDNPVAASTKFPFNGTVGATIVPVVGLTETDWTAAFIGSNIEIEVNRTKSSFFIVGI